MSIFISRSRLSKSIRLHRSQDVGGSPWIPCHQLDVLSEEYRYVSVHLSFTERTAEEMGDLGNPVDSCARKSLDVLMPLIRYKCPASCGLTVGKFVALLVEVGRRRTFRTRMMINSLVARVLHW